MRRVLLLSFAMLLSCGICAQTEDSAYNQQKLLAKGDTLRIMSLELLAKGEYDKGIATCEQALEIFKQAVGEDDQRYVNTCDMLCIHYVKSQKYTQAIKLLHLILSIKERTLGKEHDEYLNVLGMLMSCNIQVGEYTEAIKYGSQKLEIRKTVPNQNNLVDIATTLDALATCYYYIHDYEQAISMLRESLDIRKEASVQDDISNLNTLGLLINICSESGDNTQAIEYILRQIEIYRKVYGETSPLYITSLDNLAVHYYNVRDYTKAIKTLKESLGTKEKTWGKNNASFITALSFLVSLYSETGNYSKAIEFGTQLLDIQKEVYGEESQEYARSLVDVGTFYFGQANYDKATELWARALKIQEKVLGTEHSDNAMTLGNLAVAYIKIGRYEEALQTAAKASDIIEKVSGTDNQVYAKLLTTVATSEFELGHIAVAIKTGLRALDIQKKVLGEGSTDCALSLQQLSIYQAYLDNYSEAIKLCTQAIDIFKSSGSGTLMPEYASSLSHLAFLYSETGDYVSAIKSGEEALNIIRETLGERHPDYATSLEALSSIYASIGDYTKALQLEEEVLSIRKGTLGERHPEYATSLEKLSSLYDNIGDYNRALQLVEEVVNIRETTLGTNHPLYASSCHLMAFYLFEEGKYEEATNMALLSMESREKNANTLSIDLVPTLTLASLMSCMVGNYGRATDLGRQALEITTKSGLDKWHPEYVSSVMLQCLTAYCSDDSNLLNHYTIEANESLAKLVKNTFPNLTSMQRNQFWEKYQNWYENLLHRYSYSVPSGELSSCAYDGILLSKGLMLNTEIAFTQLIKECGDNVTLGMYENLRNMRTQANKLWEDYASADSVKRNYLWPIADSLKREADKVELELVNRSKIYGDYTKNLVITWDQVQEKLTDKDIAVEFVSFLLNVDSTMYIAYALKKDWECPKMIKLFEEKDLQSARAKGSIYGNDAVSRLVWKPLDEMMQGVENVYFAPSGELYNIAIESVPTHEDRGQTLVGEHRNYYRLSSTRELALIKDENKWKKAAVYGGLQYGMSVEDMIRDDGKYEKRDAATRSDSSPSYYVTREDRKGRDVSVSVEIKPLNYLKGTLEEAIAIKEDLERQSVSTQLFTDNIGTETSFKDLHGRKTSIIHIGTHGFFNDRKKKNKENNLQLLGIDQQAKVIEDDALTRSGLYFAGADSARIYGSSAIPDSIDDGKLTALEIAQLDLRGLDLVVLSACQTGLGEITGDGVFGLQRGFKKAGAQTIVMSLWKVDDEATTEFMTTFFENIEIDCNGHPLNKHEAFKEAQSKLKQNKDKYIDPYCWAAFVMLDGV